MKVFYLANIRVPTEKAHGLQIMQMCEAFASCGAELTLLAAQRINTAELTKIADPWAYYGVAQNFKLQRIACLDLFPWLGVRFAGVANAIQTLTYLAALTLHLLTRNADIYYSREMLTLLALSLFKPRQTLLYEVHQLSKSRLGISLQSLCARRVAAVIGVTGTLANEMRSRGARQVITAHDGFRGARFANVPDRTAARRMLNLPPDAFIVGYAGRLNTLGMSKGIDYLIDAIALSKDCAITLCLVGGPDDAAQSLRARWLASGLPAERFRFEGHIAPGGVPTYLAAFDVCAMPSPRTDFFAYQASPLKLFEYMAVGGAILSSNHPAVAEVVHDGESALLVPPEDVPALAGALRRLFEDPALRDRLGAAARRDSGQYSWGARAERILQLVRTGGS